MPNAGGPRTIEEAVEIAKRHGVVVHDDIKFFVDPEMDPSVYATYGGFESARPTSWCDLYSVRGWIPVKVRDSVLESDEAIVAVFAHEMHELNKLRERLASGVTVKGAVVIEWIRPGSKGNLHDQAWDEADKLVARMRSK